MSTITKVARSIVNCAMASVFAASLAANAAAPVPPVPPPPPPKPKPYQAIVHNDATAAYEYRTRILTGKPGCQRFATESDNVFVDDKMEGGAKVSLLRKIGADAAAAGCLAP